MSASEFTPVLIEDVAQIHQQVKLFTGAESVKIVLSTNTNVKKFTGLSAFHLKYLKWTKIR